MTIQGGAAVTRLAEDILLLATPMVINMSFAVVYLSFIFGPYQGFVTIATGAIFFQMAKRLAIKSRTASYSRLKAHQQECNVRQSGLLGWQTATFFNQIGFEDNRHADAVSNRSMIEKCYALDWCTITALQTVVLAFGLLTSTVVAILKIQESQATVGQFVMLLMIWSQLTSSLQSMTGLGTSVSDNFTNAQLLLDVMKTKPMVCNKRGTRPLKFVSGIVELDGVSFGYRTQQEIIKNVSLYVPAGQMVAIVGTTGAGKSTLLKLLTRLYNVTQGRIMIDGQDIRQVDLFRLVESP